MRSWAHETAPLVHEVAEIDVDVAERLKKRLVAARVRGYHPVPTTGDGVLMRGALTFLLDEAIDRRPQRVGVIPDAV